MSTTNTVTLNLPEMLYLRLLQTAQATRRPLDEVVLRVLEVGSPPAWNDAPAEFQADLAALDRLDDEALWYIVRSSRSQADMRRYQELLDRHATGTLSDAERRELDELRLEADRFMLLKAHAAALLRWRGYQLPSPEPSPKPML
jgi:hypothetical protein